MEPEVYQYMLIELENDRETLRCNISVTVQEQYQEQLNQLDLNNAEQLHAALNSPAFGDNQRADIINRITEQQRGQHEALLAEIEEEEHRLYCQQNTLLESIYFEDYGGTQENAEQLVREYEEGRLEKVSQNFQSEWRKENHVQAAQEIKYNDNQDEHLTSKFNDHAGFER
jgi:hypothetical protein